jgi:hypothetical protein
MNEHKSEEEFIDEMKDAIHDTAVSVARKVNKSALAYMNKKDWLPKDQLQELTLFFSEKIPKVMSDELSKELNAVLGLDLKL